VRQFSPKTRTNKEELLIANIISQATLVAKEQNWSLVIQYLQEIPLNQQKNRWYLAQESAWEQVLQLNLAVLYYGDFQQRWEIVKLIPRLGKRVIKPLLALVENQETELEIRWFVCRLLAEFEEESVVVALVRLLQQTEEGELAIAACQSLGQMGIIAVQALSKLLLESETRLLAVRSLAYIRRRETIAPLLQVVTDPQPEIRATAIEALGSFHDELIPPILLEALKDTSARVRKEAAIALGMRQDLRERLDLVTHLQPLLYDLNLEVCYQAAISLGRMEDDRAAAALFKVLKSEVTPKNLKRIVVRALSWIESEQTLDYLQESLQREDSLVCQEIITVLGRVEQSNLKIKATQILIEFFDAATNEQKQPQLKQTLAMSLGELGQSEALITLNQLATDNQTGVRLHAIAALKKIRDR
jgi:HEAT repeat protein